MEDANLIAYLHPAVGNRQAVDTIQMNKHTGRYVSKLDDGKSGPDISKSKSDHSKSGPDHNKSNSDHNKSKSKSKSDDTESEPASPASTAKDGDESPKEHHASLQLTFSVGPRAGRGFVIGRDPDCDIIMPQKLKMISQHHCALTFDGERRLILQDYSRHGTIVTYNGQGGECDATFH